MRRIALTTVTLMMLAIFIVAVYAQPVHAICIGSEEVTVTQGEVKTGFYLEEQGGGKMKDGEWQEIPVHLAAKASGSAADWVAPQTVDLGILAVGEKKRVENAFTLTVPENAAPGSYNLVWTFYDADSPTEEFSCFVYDIQVVQETSQIGLIQFRLDSQAYLILGAIAVIIVLAIIVSSMRKRSAPPPPQPSSVAAAQKYCIECGSPMRLEAAYCPRCGRKQ